MDENQILVTSIGESTLAYIGRDNIRRLSIELVPSLAEARVLLSPEAHDYDSQIRLLTKFAEVEDLFHSEVAMTIRLVPEDAPDYEGAGARELAFTA